MSTLSERETEQVRRANDSGRTPVVFIHGLWLLGGSWDRWTAVFEERGLSAVAADWPGDPASFDEAIAKPDTFAGKRLGEVAGHLEEVVRALEKKPAIVGHSFGGLLTLILAGRGLAAASVAISPAPFRGVLPLPFPALRSSSAVLKNPLNRGRAVRLTYREFRYGFANTLGEDEARQLYDTYSVAGPGAPVFQAAAANLNPFTELKVDTRNPERGPLLVITSDQDHQVPPAIAKAAYKKEKRNEGVTELRELPGRGHALTIDSGWHEVADVALEFVERFVPASKATALA
jgi:non-heme chloroperoxidase